MNEIHRLRSQIVKAKQANKPYAHLVQELRRLKREKRCAP